MAQLLYKLRGVPEIEADEIRQLLTQHQIDFYETPADKWGVSMPAIWVADEVTIDKAKQLLEDHHRDYTQKRKLDSTATDEPLMSYWLRKPITFLGYVALILFVLYLVISPFLSFMETA